MPRYVQPRPALAQPPDPSIRFIALTRGQICVVDAIDFEWLSKLNWMARRDPTNGKFYAERHVGGKTVTMHRLVLDAKTGEMTDHIDGNTLDNRRSNLRKATNAENQRNRGLPQNNTSGLKGVRVVSGRWLAQICCDGKDIHLGSYDTPEQAARAYDEAAKKYHGEFARLNFPEQSYR